MIVIILLVVLGKDCSQKKWCGEMRKDKSHAAPKEDVKGGEESNLAGYLNLSSTSLILFDEVSGTGRIIHMIQIALHMPTPVKFHRLHIYMIQIAVHMPT